MLTMNGECLPGCIEFQNKILALNRKCKVINCTSYDTQYETIEALEQHLGKYHKEYYQDLKSSLNNILR